MIAALCDADGVVINTFVLNTLDEYPGAVPCPGHVGIGMRIDAPEPAPEPETPEQTKARLKSSVQAHLDAAARSAGYDSILSACSYAGAPNPYQAEGAKFLAWRGEVWAHCYQALTDVQSGERAVPSEGEFIAGLPQLDRQSP